MNLRSLLAPIILAALVPAVRALPTAFDGPPPRVIVSTDIGGTDFDDYQSLVHLLLYADVLDLEGLISSPHGAGRAEDILAVIDLYERDYPNLRSYSARYPTPEALRALTKQGETEIAPHAGVRRPTEGSEWIIARARRDDPRPLHVLVWGGLEDLAQALHDAPDILPKLRVYFIGGPNKKWSPDAYHYLARNHRDLWMIESNATYRGIFVGGNQEDGLDADAFAATHADGRGALGDFLARGIDWGGEVRTSLKMGDTPSVTWLLRGDPSKPFQPGWGGRYVRAWARPLTQFNRLTTAADRMEHFGLLELTLPLGDDAPEAPEIFMEIENQRLPGHPDGRGSVRFRFSPKDAKVYRYTLVGNVSALEGGAGAITVVSPSLEAALRPDPRWPNWWTDDPSPAAAEGAYHGAATISQWREDFLLDFARRLERCRTPAAPVRLSEVTWGGVGCYRIEMPMGTVYFEKDNGVSGFKSFFDKEGNDWIASYLPPGPNGEFRGFPNSVDNFGHAGRDSGSTTTIVDGRTEGDHVILESSNADFTFQYWFFPDRVAIKVLRSKGDYCFLLETVAGGTADAEDYFVAADGVKRFPRGEFQDFSPEWIYLGDPKVNHVLFFAKTPDDDAPNENHRQIRPNGQHNMDLYSFGRAGREQGYEIRGMRGDEHVCVIGFMDAALEHEEIAERVEGFLDEPFAVKTVAAEAPVDLSGLRWSDRLLRAEAAWYASDEARAAAEQVIRYQLPSGGWPKNTDLLAPLTEELRARIERGRVRATIDNGATTLPIRFLARVAEATDAVPLREAVARGVDYLLASQYPNGGFPQYYPLRKGYYSHITYNDGAMIQALELLRDVAGGRAPFGMLDGARRVRAADAVSRGIACILATQVKKDGRPTVWCAQHDEHTLEPAWARAYEPPSLSGAESVGIVRFLMSIDDPSPAVVEAVEGAVAWFREVALEGYRVESVEVPGGRNDRVLVPDPDAPPLWARFYELGSHRPLYLDRDSEFNYDFAQVSYERRSGYAYHGNWPATLLERHYPAWRASR
jgi:PelA/Pel-15E family pectate lyase